MPMGARLRNVQSRRRITRSTVVLAVVAIVAVMLLSSVSAQLNSRPSISIASRAVARASTPYVTGPTNALSQSSPTLASASDFNSIAMVTGGGRPVDGSWSGAPAPADATNPSQELVMAESSLAAGSRPSAGQPWSCSLSSVGGSVDCAASGVSAASPSARYGANLVYDAKDGYVLLFGGLGASGFRADTWKFVGGSWTRLSPATHPTARYGAAMTYDAKDGYVLLFGGYESPDDFTVGDTWKFVGGAWTELSAVSPPEARYFAAMTYDAKDGYVVLFGGNTPLSTVQHNDTWKFVGGAWTNITGSAGPMPGQSYTSMTYDPADAKVVMLGNVYYPYTWTFSGGKWTEL